MERMILRLAVFAAGALLMALEVSAFRIIGKTFGSALRETTTVIAVFLAAMAAGYWAGGRAGDRWPRPATLTATLFAAAAACFCVPWLDAWISPRIAASNLALATHAFAATSVLFAIPTLLLAATSPIAVRLFTKDTRESGSTAGSISAISTAGSIAGSLITAFFLIDWLASISRTVIFVGLGAAAVATVTVLATEHGRSSRRIVAAGAGLAVILVLSAAFARSTAIDRSLLAPLPGTKIVYAADSPYHHIEVRQRHQLRELKFDVVTQTRMKMGEPFGPGLAYADSMLLARLMRPEIRRVLHVGLGGGTSPKHYAHYFPDVTVDAVDVDPLVLEVAQKYFAVTPNERLRLHASDGRTFLARSSETWDLIVIDTYTTNRYGDTIPQHMVTREFFEQVAARLAPGGIVHFHCAFDTSALLPALQRTMASVFPSTARTRGEILASKFPLLTDRGELAARHAASPVAHFAQLRGAIAALQVEAPPRDAPLLTDDYAPVDTLLRARR